MKISKIEKIIKFDTKFDLVKSLIYIKLLERKIKLNDNELNMLTLFSQHQGIDEVVTISLSRNYIKVKGSGDNAISKLTNLGILSKTGIGKRKIAIDVFPDIVEAEGVAAFYKIHNINVTN